MNTVTEYINRVKHLCRIDPERTPPTIYVAGPVNAGKSTLINSLLGERISPVAPSPSTFFPLYFSYSETPRSCKVVRGRSIPLSERELSDTLKNRRRMNAPEKAEIYLPRDILRWCPLVDTPGVGLHTESDKLLRDCLSAADGIIFLFHQRGIDSGTHHFLKGLASAGLRGWISFWINANLGPIDGTSLTETSRALRTIFPGRTQINAINTNDRSGNELVSLFLQVKALESAVRGIEAKLAGWDRMIPGMLERASMQENEERFLVKFWEAVEKSEIVNRGGQSVKDLPLIQGSLANILRTYSLALVTETRVTASPRRERGPGSAPGNRIASLLSSIQSDKDLKRYINRDLLKKATDSLENKFRVIVTGPFSTGKTTFLNALLGETLLPAEDRATTSCAVRLRYGREKTAAVDYLYRAEFFPVVCREGKYLPDRGEIDALTQFLDNPRLRKMVGACEVCRDGIYKSITLSELAGVLDEIIRYRRGPARIPLFTRKPAGVTARGSVVTSIRITPGIQRQLTFNLDDDRQRLVFYKTISPPASCLLDGVTLHHPSENIVFADFIDTPGLDSLHRRHYHRARKVLSSGDLLLVFLHAKHLLTGSLPEQAVNINHPGLGPPVVYVINFADTVSVLDRERVSLYIRQQMSQGSDSSTIIPYPRVYSISALNALHRWDEGFDRLLRQVRKEVEENENKKIARAAGPIRECLLPLAAEKPSIPARVRQSARTYLAQLENTLKKN